MFFNFHFPSLFLDLILYASIGRHSAARGTSTITQVPIAFTFSSRATVRILVLWNIDQTALSLDNTWRFHCGSARALTLVGVSLDFIHKNFTNSCCFFFANFTKINANACSTLNECSALIANSSGRFDVSYATLLLRSPSVSLIFVRPSVCLLESFRF